MVKYKLYGAILGDLCGQPYEFPIMKGPYINVQIHNPNSYITDDTLMTLATAQALIENISFEQAYKEMGLKYQGNYYGKGFQKWINSPYGTIGDSFGNGCLMRLSPIMYINDDCLKSDLIFHSCNTSHLSGISLESCFKLKHLYNRSSDQIWYCQNFSKEKDILNFTKFKVKANDTLDFIQNLYFNNFSTNTHKTIIKAVECGGDTDTNASIIGELMNYTYNDLTIDDVNYVESKLDSYLLSILHNFNKKFKD